MSITIRNSQKYTDIYFQEQYQILLVFWVTASSSYLVGNIVNQIHILLHCVHLIVHWMNITLITKSLRSLITTCKEKIIFSLFDKRINILLQMLFRLLCNNLEAFHSKRYLQFIKLTEIFESCHRLHYTAQVLVVWS